MTLLNPGSGYSTAPTVIFEGGGGQDARGSAKLILLVKLTSIAIANPGEFYQEAPYILITGGGGIGAKAEATINQGQITESQLLRKVKDIQHLQILFSQDCKS